MLPVYVRFRSEARAHVWAWLALALLVAVASGAVTAITAGARRTDTAYPRFLASHASGDFFMGNSFASLGQPIDLAAVARLPGVATTGVGAFLPAVGRTDSGREIYPSNAAPGAPADDHYSNTIDRWKLLAGRRTKPRSLDEAVASFEFARQFDVHVGSIVHLQFLPARTATRLLPQYLATLADRVAGRSGSVDIDSVWNGPKVAVRIVGIEAAQFEFPPRGAILPPLLMSRAFYEKYAPRVVSEDIMHVRLRPRASRHAFHAAVERLAGGSNPPEFTASTSNASDVERSLHLEALVLFVLAGLVGASVMFILAQAFARQAYIASDDFPALSAIGMTRRQLVGVGVLRAGVTAALGAVLGVVVAIAMSPIWPLGLARDAEPHPGLAVDWFVIGVGVLAVTLFAIVTGAIATARLATNVRGARVGWSRGSRTLGATHSGALPVSAAIGVQHALQPGRGRTAVPIRSAVLATALSVATIVVAATFTASTNHLLVTPRLYGWTDDAEIRTLTLPADQVVTGLEHNPAVAGVAAGTAVQLDVDGKTLNAVALDDVYRSVRPDLLEGRALRHDDEIILGTQTLRDRAVGIGSQVVVRDGAETARLRVVGRALFPQSGDAPGEVDQGAQITFSELRRFAPSTPRTLVRFRLVPDANPASVNARIAAAVAPFPMSTPEPPTTITSFGRTNDLPTIVATIMALVAVAALAHTLVTSVRRRRRDFAVLETLGCVRHQLSTTVAATATTFAFLACLVGLPLGIVGGRWAWGAIAGELGVPSEPTLSVAALALVAVGMVVVTNLIALVPASMARRTSPAATLRTE
ncbi:MAG TPA: FtsX-like permease family protein [Acidimicrobiia bacterium]|nr:FtsX-like permease family protein [Acidimicrobiia bacterium]